MAQVQGLEIFDEHSNKILDLTKFIPKYLGEIDITPTSSSQSCSGETVIPYDKSILSIFSNPFWIVEKIYAQSLPMSNGIDYVLPTIDNFGRSGSNCTIRWSYTIKNFSFYTQHINLGVRIKYGAF